MTRRLALAIALMVLAVSAPQPAGGETNWLDPALGGQPVTVDLGPGRDTASGLVVQRDGKTVVVGTANISRDAINDSNMAVLRFRRDGVLDPTFGDGGKVFLDNEHRVEGANAVALQPDGKIVVVGDAGVWRNRETSQMAVARLDQAGRPDPTFNGGEMMILGMEWSWSSARAVALQADGKVVVAGVAAVHYDTTRRVNDVAVIRLTSAGVLDESFGDGGLILTDFGYDTYDEANFVAVRPDGRIVIAGTLNTSSFSGPPPVHQTLVQYTAAGALDVTFGRGGTVLSPAGRNTTDAVLRPDGTVVTTGEAFVDRSVRLNSRSVAVTAYRADGSVDTGFGVGGTTVSHAPVNYRDGAMTTGGGNSTGASIALDARGRLVVAGFASGFSSADAAVVRYNSAGALDTSFGRAGWMKTDTSGQDALTAVGLLPGGGIFATGQAMEDGMEKIMFVIYPAPDRPVEADGWGWNILAQLGNGTTVDRSVPVSVAAPAGAASVAGGAVHSLALADDGTVSAWGWNALGQLGDGTVENRSRPVRVAGLTRVASVAAGHYHSLAVVGGSVKAWGWNGLGQLGDGTIIDRRQPASIPGLSGVVGVSAGALHSLAVRDDGTVWAWGWNGVGQLGDGTLADRRLPVVVPGLANIVAVAAGTYHSLALSGDGTVWAWGWNPVGQVGDGSTVDRLRPIPVLANGVVAIAAGGLHSVALNSEGKVWGWGYNWYGQVGDGSILTRLRPVPVPALPESNSVAAGLLHTVAITAQGQVRGWGWNGVGQLGDGTIVDRHLPVPARGAPAEAVGAGAYHSLATGS